MQARESETDVLQLLEHIEALEVTNQSDRRYDHDGNKMLVENGVVLLADAPRKNDARMLMYSQPIKTSTNGPSRHQPTVGCRSSRIHHRC